MPCELCNDLKKRVEDDVCLAFEFTPDELARSAYDAFVGRCDSCIVILEAIRQFESSHRTFKRDVKKVYARCREKHRHGTESLSLELYFKDDQPKLLLELYSLQPHAWKAILPRPSISGHPLSSQALQWVRMLLSDCTQTHVSCSSSDIPRLPKRLISIQNLDDGSIEVRLVENEQDESGLYVALSHCWGTQQACTTTLASLDDRKANIAWDSIPKTFQDAIKFALALDICLIWVDSLCIIQDDTIDWETESSKMADIYQNAFITLAATSSSGDADGCFPEVITSPSYVEVSAPESVADTSRIAVRRALGHWDDSATGGTQNQFPLLARAWALQERLLAPRIVHFSDTELVWECRERTTCECGSVDQSGSPCGDFYQALRRSQEENQRCELDCQGIKDMLFALELQRQEDEMDQTGDEDNETYFNGLTRVKTDLYDAAEDRQGEDVFDDSVKANAIFEESNTHKEFGQEERGPVGVKEYRDSPLVSSLETKAFETIKHKSISEFETQGDNNKFEKNGSSQLNTDDSDVVTTLSLASEYAIAGRHDDGGRHAMDLNDGLRVMREISEASNDAVNSRRTDGIMRKPELEDSQPTADCGVATSRQEIEGDGAQFSQEEESVEDVAHDPAIPRGLNVDAYLSTLPSQNRSKLCGKAPNALDEETYRLWPLRYDIVDRQIEFEWDHQSTSLQDILKAQLRKYRPISMDIVQHYHGIVERYSALGLTRPSDKLPALSGICARLRYMRGDFCAGLWLNTLAIDLMWRVNNLDPNAKVGGRASPFRGPTWSWVSIESPVAYWSDLTDFDDTRMFLSYDTNSKHQRLAMDEPRPPELEVELAGRNAFGEVRSCSLVVWGLLKEGNLEYTYLRYDSPTPGGVDISKYNIRINTTMFGDRRNDSQMIEISFFADYPLALDGPNGTCHVPNYERVALLLIYPTVALVLRPQGETGNSDIIRRRCKWERIGIARISNTAFYDYKLDWMRGSRLQRVTLI